MDVLLVMQARLSETKYSFYSLSCNCILFWNLVFFVVCICQSGIDPYLINSARAGCFSVKEVVYGL